MVFILSRLKTEICIWCFSSCNHLKAFTTFLHYIYCERAFSFSINYTSQHRGTINNRCTPPTLPCGGLFKWNNAARVSVITLPFEGAAYYSPCRKSENKYTITMLSHKERNWGYIRYALKKTITWISLICIQAALYSINATCNTLFFICFTYDVQRSAEVSFLFVWALSPL